MFVSTLGITIKIITWNFSFEFSLHYSHYYLFLNVLLKLEQSIFQLCNLIGRSSGNADVCCLTEQLGRHFWHVKKTSSSSDAQPPYLAPLSLAWRQAHIISSTWDRKPWGAAAGSGDTVSVVLALDLFTSTAAATMSLLQFNLEANVRSQGLRVGGGEGWVRWHEAVDMTFPWAERLFTMVLQLG